MVSIAEGKELANSGAVAASANDQDWDAAWDDEEGHNEPAAEENASAAAGDDDGADAWGWDDEPDEPSADQPAEPELSMEDDDGADAWGWGDEDVTEEPPPEPKPAKPAKPAPEPRRKAPAETQTREMVMRETYHVSSMPEPVLNLIFSILEDGAKLTVMKGWVPVLTSDRPCSFAHTIQERTQPGCFGGEWSLRTAKFGPSSLQGDIALLLFLGCGR